ncbi:hypothetical protein CDL12_10140 [Handroanthus impetiginosus]|uniref:Uncharacterized protein n=1 Tax=Handroanthus impetiginosus TaxID=429701 RepID=A0A2G9HI91_9LAMI|nr:hypothetical protein CDL12_10140 [Handroanthus impetiginosus]
MQQLCCTIPYVHCVINKLILHFKISILQPQHIVLTIHRLKRPVPHRSSTSKILLRFFPLPILHPNTIESSNSLHLRRR